MCCRRGRIPWPGSRGFGEGSGVVVDDRHDGDHAFGSEGEAVLEGGFGGAADFHAVHVDVARGHLAGDRGTPLDEVDDDTVLGDDHPVGIDAGTDGEVAVGPEVTPFAVDGHDVPGLDVVAVDEFTSAGVPGDVHLGVALVDDVGTSPGQPVDHPVNGFLIARDQGAGEEDRVALADADHMSRLAIRDSAAEAPATAITVTAAGLAVTSEGEADLQ